MDEHAVAESVAERAVAQPEEPADAASAERDARVEPNPPRLGLDDVLGHPLTRRGFLTLAGGATAAAAVAACAPTAPGASPGATITGGVRAPDIPKSTVRFGVFPCCPDQNMAFVPIRLGYYNDLGISLNPPDAQQFTAAEQGTPAMQRGDLDIIVNFIQGYLQTLNTFGMNMPPFLFHDIFLGITILKAPDNPAKTTEDFVGEGLPFPEAAKQAVEQLRGQEVHTPSFGTVQPQQPIVYLSYANMKYEDVKLVFIDDTKIVELAAAPGRLKYAIPLGAGVIVQLIRNGWKPVINTKLILENDPGSRQAKELTKLVGSSGLAGQRKFWEEQHDTVLRFVSAWFRTIDTLMAKDQAALKIVADTVNASQGLKLTPEDVSGVYENIDPFFPFAQQGAQLWDDPNAPFYVKTTLQTQIQSLIDNGTLPNRQYDIERFLVAEDVYKELASLKGQYDSQVGQAASLTGDRKTLADRARQFYQWHDYLDAVNFLKAALA